MLIPKKKVIEFVKKSIETNKTVWHEKECQNLNIIFGIVNQVYQVRCFILFHNFNPVAIDLART